MQVFLIEENPKPKTLKKILKVIEIIEDRIILNFTVSKFKFNRKVAVTQKIKKILELNESDKIILSKNLKCDKDFVNLLYSKDIDIVQGKVLMKFLINKIVDKLCIQNNIKVEETEVGICINNISEVNVKLIENLAMRFKMVKIITNDINNFTKIQKKLLDEHGIMLIVTNNKKKGLLNVPVVVNIDFPEEIINRYNIYDKSILINLEENIKINKKRFCGKIVNDYKIKLKKGSKIEQELSQDKYRSFDLKDLAEIYIMNNPQEIDNILILKYLY